MEPNDRTLKALDNCLRKWEAEVVAARGGVVTLPDRVETFSMVINASILIRKLAREVAQMQADAAVTPSDEALRRMRDEEGQ